MAIDLPPPIEPVPAPLEQVRAAAPDDLPFDYQGLRLHVAGPDGRLDATDRARLAQLVAASPTVSDAVRGIGRYFYLARHRPPAITRYAVDGERDVYVHVSCGHVAAVEGPPILAAPFGGLVHAQCLSEAEFERARVIGDALSTRAGEHYRPQFRLGEGDAVTLDFGPPQPGDSRTAVVADFGNSGNRYAGPYLFDLALRQAFASGDELTLAGTTAVRALGLGGRHSEPYHGGSAGWSRVTGLGVFSLGGRLADFQQSAGDLRYDGRVDGGTLGWLAPLQADFTHRLNLELKFERSHERLTARLAAGGPGLTQSETVNVAALGLNYVQRLEGFGGLPLDLSAALGARKGVPAGSSVETAASTAFFVVQPALDLRQALGEGFTALASGRAQLGGSSLPQVEQFVIGGPQSLHAYQAGAGAGDSGAEARLGLEWRDEDGSPLERYGIRPRLFAEYGTTRLRQTAFGAGAGRIDVADVGVASDVRFTSWLGGSLSAAQSIHERGRASSDNGLARRYVFFQLVARY